VGWRHRNPRQENRRLVRLAAGDGGLIGWPADRRATMVAVRRVAVIGSGGAGKSTLARALGERLGIEVVHLDRLYWRPGWIPTPNEEWRALQAELVERESWIIDGNYGGTLDVRLGAADAVVFLDFPRRTTVPAVLRRWWRHRGHDVQAPGCAERLDGTFVRWVWNYRRDSRPRALAAIAAHARHAQVVTLTTRAAVRRFLAEVPGADEGASAGGR
jgi:adenylate kinase family enzyme